MIIKPKKRTVFLASTFKDLKFERRAVARELIAAGYRILAMEDNPTQPGEAFRWSIQTSMTADIFLLLYDGSSGSTSSPDIMPGLPPMPFTHWEAKFAQHHTAVQLIYKLNRPFPDWRKLLDDETETEEYLMSLNNNCEKYVLGARPLYLQHRKDQHIQSVEEMLDRIIIDLKRTWFRTACHRLAPNVSRRLEYLFLNTTKWLPRKY